MTLRELPILFCFSGQGSQYFQMGSDLYRSQPVFRDWMDIGDEVVRGRHGFSPVAEMFAPGKSVADPFGRLEETNPALFLVQYALAKTVMHAGIRPDAALGISLGETVSMALAGMCSFEVALAAVSDHPAVYRRTCPPGGMTAFLGDPAQVEALPEMAGGAVLAGVNGPRHGVISGTLAGLDGVEEALARLEIPFQRLPVPYAFHSPWIDGAASGFRDIQPTHLAPGRWTCWSSRLAAPTDPTYPDLWWDVVRGPMSFAKTIAAIEAGRRGEGGGVIYLDLGPSSTISTILRQGLAADSPSRVVSVLSPMGGGLVALEKALGALANRGPAKPGSRNRLMADGE
ncbi:acyltransferase domain-containing protein [Rhodospirillum sp. A1_3_36]|uniref:acyltransferase domain-containing protein n=1 Tax=Rhodospirillum sp. A1_3_36 TaxID=3391666 RepID=UPI0039A66B69